MTESILDRTKVVIFDVDGTIADCEHRRKYVDGTLGHTDWKKFRARQSLIHLLYMFAILQKDLLSQCDHVVSSVQETNQKERLQNNKFQNGLVMVTKVYS